MDGVILGGDINGKANWGRKQDPSSNTVTAHRMTAQSVCVTCACACVCAGWMTDEKAQPSASEYVINIITVDRANCNVSEITNPQVTPHIKQSDNCITRVNGHCYCFGNNRDVL